MRTSKLGITIVREFESFSAAPYICPGGHNTIGWGHLIKSGEQFETITEAEADSILAEDLQTAEKAVDDLVTVPLSQWQYDALVSFTFNLGRGNLSRSTLLTCLNKGLFVLAANEFERWVYAGGNRLAGLITRRRCEKIIFRAGTKKEAV